MAVVSLVVVLVYIGVAIGVVSGLLAGNWEETVGKSYQSPSWVKAFQSTDTENSTLQLLTSFPRKVATAVSLAWNEPALILGTDIFGQSVLRKTIYAAKTSLTVAFVASLISIGIGLPLGAIAGYFGKKIDDLIVWLYSTLESIPYILLILAFAFVLKDKVLNLPYPAWNNQGLSLMWKTIPLTGITAVYLAIGLTSWVGLCRLIRGEVLKHKNRDYVVAARAFGASDRHIIFRHIVPNVFHLVIIDFSLRFVSFIHAEVILSFLGLGAKEEPSWGVMIDDARMELGRGVWWQMAAATLAIFLISLALNLVGDALRDALDPKLKGR
ncbi:MAG: ABC transporter permease [Phycisphaerae bacterium]|nr:ABC transporter permease [Phycisphaerae bacterium]